MNKHELPLLNLRWNKANSKNLKCRVTILAWPNWYRAATSEMKNREKNTSASIPSGQPESIQPNAKVKKSSEINNREKTLAFLQNSLSTFSPKRKQKGGELNFALHLCHIAARDVHFARAFTTWLKDLVGKVPWNTFLYFQTKTNSENFAINVNTFHFYQTPDIHATSLLYQDMLGVFKYLYCISCT